jgi:hypothetical protein
VSDIVIKPVMVVIMITNNKNPEIKNRRFYALQYMSTKLQDLTSQKAVFRKPTALRTSHTAIIKFRY